MLCSILCHWHARFLWRSVSKQQAIIPGQSYQLEDGSTSFKDFHGSRNNRFSTAEQAAKNRIQRPSNVLHFFNGQPDSSTEIFAQVQMGCMMARSSFIPTGDYLFIFYHSMEYPVLLKSEVILFFFSPCRSLKSSGLRPRTALNFLLVKVRLNYAAKIFLSYFKSRYS